MNIINVRHCRKINLHAIEDVERRVCSRTRTDALNGSAGTLYEAYAASGEMAISLSSPDTALVKPEP